MENFEMLLDHVVYMENDQALMVDESDWWVSNRDAYDAEDIDQRRIRNRLRRGEPETRQPMFFDIDDRKQPSAPPQMPLRPPKAPPPGVVSSCASTDIRFRPDGDGGKGKGDGGKGGDRGGGKSKSDGSGWKGKGGSSGSSSSWNSNSRWGGVWDGRSWEWQWDHPTWAYVWEWTSPPRQSAPRTDIKGAYAELTASAPERRSRLVEVTGTHVKPSIDEIDAWLAELGIEFDELSRTSCHRLAVLCPRGKQDLKSILHRVVENKPVSPSQYVHKATLKALVAMENIRMGNPSKYERPFQFHPDEQFQS